jgi:hypothetical protein
VKREPSEEDIRRNVGPYRMTKKQKRQLKRARKRTRVTSSSLDARGTGNCNQLSKNRNDWCHP